MLSVREWGMKMGGKEKEKLVFYHVFGYVNTRVSWRQIPDLCQVKIDR